MNQIKLLSGHELVTKSLAKIEISLPEAGLKEIFKNGSWLERKQVQAAIDARKQLIDVERIEKSGTKSHAIWRQELMLAEVTEKVGSYWKYFGHNVSKKLYLYPEEALFLTEINSLHLTYNDVKVSLQQAYSLLLRGKTELMEYRVYASLSRIGYRVYRHEYIEPKLEEIKIENPEDDDIDDEDGDGDEKMGKFDVKNINIKNEIIIKCKEDSPVIETKPKVIDEADSKKFITEKNKRLIIGRSRLQKLENRTLKPCNMNNIHKFFESFPDLTQKQIVSINSPQAHFIPNTITLSKSVFNVNLQNIHSKNDRYNSNETNIYTDDEVNDGRIKEIINKCSKSESNAMPAYSSIEFANRSYQYRQLNFYRPRQTYRSINFSMLFQRHYLPNWFFTSRLQSPRIQTQVWQTTGNTSNFAYKNSKKRALVQKENLEEIKKLAMRLKQLIPGGNKEEEFIQSLQILIQTYNNKYKTRVRLNQDYNIVIEETIVDTIELDDDEEPGRKRPRTESFSSSSQMEENLNKLRNIASQLKELEENKKSSPRHRRAFSKLLRTFNKSYNEEYYLNESNELENKKIISKFDTFDIEPLNPKKIKEEPGGKKLKNPFNVLKRLSERKKELNPEPSTSKKEFPEVEHKEYSPLLSNTFTKHWLPPENDFGRAEIVSKDNVYNEISEINREEILYDFLKIHTCKCENWLELKKTFYTSIKEATAEFQNGFHNRKKINSIVKPGDCTDLVSILKKLRIIQAEKGTDERNIVINFDMFSRHVQNFRKTQRETPHGYIICLDDKGPLPTGGQIAALYTKYNNDVPIVFAIVGDSSISYLQITPTDLPVHISNKT